MTRRPSLVLLTLSLALAAPVAARADQRYASPAGAGTECTTTKPCSLAEAVNKAKSNDEVIVRTGTYMESALLEPPSGTNHVAIHGDFGAPMPVIDGTTLRITGEGSELAYLSVRRANDFTAAVSCSSGTGVDRLRAEAKGSHVTGIVVGQGCEVRDSLLLADGQEATALFASGTVGTGSALVRNVTAIASGMESVAIRSSFSSFLIEIGSFELDLRNSVASGGGADLVANESPFGPGNIRVGNSNFDSTKEGTSAKVTDAGGNQKAAPVFLNAAGGDYREATGSPTIDAGLVDRIGPLDLAGAARVQGSAPDIGAFELAPPPRPAALVGRIESLSVQPRRFRAASSGEAVASFKDKVVRPPGAFVSYSLSAAGTVQFTVERKLSGRKVGKRCVTRTRANRSKKRCPLFKPVKGSFADSGAAGQNRFRFSGRLDSRSLKPGAYRLTGSAGGATLRAPFTIVKR
jgi:hypothetical protein